MNTILEKYKPVTAPLLFLCGQSLFYQLYYENPFFTEGLVGILILIIDCTLTLFLYAWAYVARATASNSELKVLFLFPFEARIFKIFLLIAKVFLVTFLVAMTIALIIAYPIFYIRFSNANPILQDLITFASQSGDWEEEVYYWLLGTLAFIFVPSFLVGCTLFLRFSHGIHTMATQFIETTMKASWRLSKGHGYRAFGVSGIIILMTLIFSVYWINVRPQDPLQFLFLTIVPYIAFLELHLGFHERLNLFSDPN